MITNVMKGIAGALHETFGDKYTIYTENVKQGFNEPCFYLFALQPTNEAAIGGHYLRSYPFDIHYFPKDENNAKAEMHHMAEALFLALEDINVLDNLRRGSTMRYEIVDGVLHFFVTYSMYVKKISESAPTMDNITYNPTVGGEPNGNQIEKN